MDDFDRKILVEIQSGFPLVKRPFEALSQELGMSESEVISRIKSLQEEGIVRRIGPILDLRQLGLKGVLVAVKVPADGATFAASVINEYDEVSHNYLRPDDSGYNLWFTLSADEKRIDEILGEIRSKTGLEAMMLPTEKIFKIGVKFDII
jgi:DNA-binding Lrp family transcriptional regulator